jgi:hypothetical protein
MPLRVIYNLMIKRQYYNGKTCLTIINYSFLIINLFLHYSYLFDLLAAVEHREIHHLRFSRVQSIPRQL